ncbi:hypothetical protein EIN_096160 [Entamoeba invadens IP1]|uniref:Uncharacterized protein n=1 Tax=Entamoeba invadens IP1 TaxID=370355 RepID=A0A0A1U0F9_ENTIV|nr:hypothetical protein EIN_096160 [Entamoeba invadens IP1]ELP87359.1 hypothetical protein EIN_096160 [Entamoeba invadens IP1]|eukprot:XP_004254130.1 hypothetical protein EIN_096160 [Entamoeba invadens IP1]
MKFTAIEYKTMLPFLEDIITARTFVLLNKTVQEAFSTSFQNAGYKLFPELVAKNSDDNSEESDMDEDAKEELLEKRFNQEMSLFSNRKVTVLTTETMQFYPRCSTPTTLPEVSCKPINFYISQNVTKELYEARIKYTITKVEQKSDFVSLEAFKKIHKLCLTIDTLYQFQLQKLIPENLEIDVLILKIKLTGNIDIEPFKNLQDYKIGRVVIICKNIKELTSFQQIPDILTNKKITLCSRFWYKGINKNIIIYWKPNVIYMTEDGVTEISILQKYNPWKMKYVDTPQD